MSKEVVSGVGVRLAEVFNLDSDGLPSVNTSSAVPVTGTLVQGIKTLTVNDPEPQRFTHYGDDKPFAQDSLPATEVGSFSITTAKTNMIFDAMAEGTKVRSLGTGGNISARGVNTDKQGQEPQVLFFAFRQALDTKKGSTTFGKLRQWEAKLYPSVRISPGSNSFEQGQTDKAYDATPTPTEVTPWNESFNETNWGHQRAEYIEMTFDYKPRINAWLGNGTISAFQLSHPPVDANHLHVWMDGTLQTPATVNTSASNPAFTLGSAATNAKKLIAIIETNAAD